MTSHALPPMRINDSCRHRFVIDVNCMQLEFLNENFETFNFCFRLQRFTEPQLIDQSVYILIGIGGLMFFLGFLGYYGAIRESQCLLSLVSFFLELLNRDFQHYFVVRSLRHCSAGAGNCRFLLCSHLQGCRKFQDSNHFCVNC